MEVLSQYSANHTAILHRSILLSQQKHTQTMLSSSLPGLAKESIPSPFSFKKAEVPMVLFLNVERIVSQWWTRNQEKLDATIDLFSLEEKKSDK